MAVKVLDQNAIEQIRSSFSIDGVTHCITELVLNSYDAKATAIAVRVNLSAFSIQVVDNGKGMSRENLERVGQQYMTSKCHSLSDLKSRLKYYGFRGESLWSICNISKCVRITSRQQYSDETYCKVIEKSSSRVDMVVMRSSFGTTITIEGFLEKLPVRQRCIKRNEIGNIKSSLEGLILIHPKISVSLRDDVTMKMVLQNQQCEDVPTALVKIHPEVDPKGFSFRSCVKGKTCVEAMFHKELNPTKKIQYIYTNKRPVVCAKIQNLITSMFKNYYKDKTNKSKHPVFVIHIKCPHSEVDFQFTATKTTAMFKKHENVTRCIEKILEKFLGEDFPLPKKVLPTFSSECGVSQIDGAIQVKGMKRKTSSIQNDDGDEEESTQKTSKIEVMETPALEHFAVPKTAPALPIAIEKRNEWASKIDSAEEFAEAEHDSEVHETEMHDTEMPQDNVTDMTFFTNFPHDEQRGKAMIMDMFIKSSLLTPSKTVYQNKTGSETSSPKNPPALIEPPKTLEPKMISVGVQTDDFRFLKALSCSSRLDETKQIFDFQNLRQKPFDILEQTGSVENVRFTPIPKINELPPRKSILKKRSKLSLKKHASSTSYGRHHSDSPVREDSNKILEELRNRKRNLKKIIMTPSLHKSRLKNDPNETISKYFTPFKKPKSFKRVSTNEIIETTDMFVKMSSQNDPLNETTSKFFTPPVKKPSVADSMDSDEIKSTLTIDQFPSKSLRKATPYPVMKNKPDETFSKYFTQSQQSKDSEDVIEETPDVFVPDLALNKNKNESEIIVTLDDESKRQVLNRDFQFRLDILKPFDTSTDGTSVRFNMEKTISGIIHRLDDEDRQEDAMKDQPVWTKEVDDYGVKVYTNRISGIKMLNTPKEDWNFVFKPRISHVPKGLSPILTDGGKVEDLSPNSRNILQNAIVESYDDELLLIKWQNCIDNQDPKQFFEEMYKEKSKRIECEIPNINKSKWAKHTDRILGGRTFTKDLLENLEVVGQVDRKFVAAFDRNTKLLLLFDQHAVHERIRVEILGESYKTSSTKLGQNITMFLPRDDLLLIKNQQTVLNALGLTYEAITDGIIILAIPTCIFNKCKKGKSLMVASAEVLIKEVLGNLKENDGVLAGTPPIIQNIMNSEACRGAIKFGDLLHMDVCCNLLRSLSDCRLPFQCAHGRPTLTPLISLDREVDTVMKPNLKKLADVQIYLQ